MCARCLEPLLYQFTTLYQLALERRFLLCGCFVARLVVVLMVLDLKRLQLGGTLRSVHICDPVVEVPIVKNFRVVVPVKHLHVSAMHHVMSQNRKISVIKRGRHCTQVGWHMACKSSDTKRRPSTRHKFGIVVDPHKIFCAGFPRLAQHRIMGDPALDNLWEEEHVYWKLACSLFELLHVAFDRPYGVVVICPKEKTIFILIRFPGAKY
mmetsp:Transcript_9426/g.32808  ORF Transcript_9426/g.32808 Transcript_9426/m.32808 type:complete len:209 (-) Transcript_9426:1192-1818(-)